MKKRITKKLFVLPKEADRALHYSVIILALFGVVMQVSASMSSSTVTLRPLIITAMKQMVFFIASYFAMIVCANYFSFESVRKHIDKLVIITGLLLIVTLAFPEAGGSNAWIKVGLLGGEVSLQPSELAKLSMILIMGIYLGDIKRQDMTAKTILLRPFLIFLTYFLIIAVLQRDLGSAIILALITLACFMIPSNQAIRGWQMAALVAFIGLVIMTSWLMSDAGLAFLEKIGMFQYQITRFKAAIDPFVNRYGAGYYDLVNSLIAFNTGGLKGVGLGKSLRKYGYLSAASTDFIMAVVVEELGIGGFIAVLLGYTIIIVKIMIHAFRAIDEKSKIVLVGIAMYFFIHFVFNIGGVTCLIPLTGIPLLLISSGGSSSLACMMALGIAQAIIVKQRKIYAMKGSVNEDHRR